MRQMLGTQQQPAIKNSREWHTVGEMDMVGPHHLTGSVKKPKSGTAHYIIAPGVCGTRYSCTKHSCGTPIESQ